MASDTSAAAWASAAAQVTLDVSGPVSFVDDNRVRYEADGGVHVQRADLFAIDDERRWLPFLNPRPSWLHFHLLPSTTGERVITLRRSSNTKPGEDARGTAINVSWPFADDDPRRVHPPHHVLLYDHAGASQPL